MEDRVKYCGVFDCVHNNGTCDPKVHMFKIPKNRDIAEKWLSFLKIDTKIRGYVCNAHFNDEYMYKDKNRLKPIAAPATFANNIEKAESKLCQKIAKHNNDVIDVSGITKSFTIVSLSPKSSACPITTMTKKTCEECMEKNDRIDKLEAEVRMLKQKLLCSNKKVSYLKKIRNDLDKAFSNMKEQNIIDEEQCKLLEVIVIIV